MQVTPAPSSTPPTRPALVFEQGPYGRAHTGARTMFLPSYTRSDGRGMPVRLATVGNTSMLLTTSPDHEFGGITFGLRGGVGGGDNACAGGPPDPSPHPTPLAAKDTVAGGGGEEADDCRTGGWWWRGGRGHGLSGSLRTRDVPMREAGHAHATLPSRSLAYVVVAGWALGKHGQTTGTHKQVRTHACPKQWVLAACRIAPCPTQSPHTDTRQLPTETCLPLR
jgi:hypothetical protein